MQYLLYSIDYTISWIHIQYLPTDRHEMDVEKTPTTKLVQAETRKKNGASGNTSQNHGNSIVSTFNLPIKCKTSNTKYSSTSYQTNFELNLIT